MVKTISITDKTHAALNGLRKNVPGTYTAVKKESFNTVIVRLLAEPHPEQQGEQKDCRLIEGGR